MGDLRAFVSNEECEESGSRAPNLAKDESRLDLGVLVKFWEDVMADTIWISVTLTFFAVAVGYVYFCDRLK